MRKRRVCGQELAPPLSTTSGVCNPLKLWLGGPTILWWWGPLDVNSYNSFLWWFWCFPVQTLVRALTTLLVIGPPNYSKGFPQPPWNLLSPLCLFGVSVGLERLIWRLEEVLDPFLKLFFPNLWPKQIIHRILQKSYFRLSRSKHPAFQANALLWQILVQTCEALKGHYRTTFCGFSTQT